ncbi:MAG: hypothetical protein KIS63_14475, partial [Caldilineales bacterium]|nr:hypothetical protein [Caldilineales bacterium]
PNDLQADIQNDYLALTADSYNLTGDLDRAVQRLNYWKALDLIQMANRFADRLQAEGRDQEAGRLRALIEDASIYQLSLSPQAEVTPSAGSASTAASLDPATQRLLLYLLLGILALAVLLVLMRLLRIPLLGPRREEEEAEAEPDEIEGVALPPMPVRRPPPPPAYTPVAVEETPDEADDKELQEDGAAADEEQTDVDDSSAEEEDLPPTATPTAPPAGAPPWQRGAAAEVLRFDGEPSYNEIRDINDRGEYAGEFGIASGKEDADTPGAVYALEIWLFDKSDIHTVTAVLMHPDSYADESRRQQLAGNYQPLAAENGAPIHLNTKSLELNGRVRRVDFGRAGSKGPTIRHLEVELEGRRL